MIKQPKVLVNLSQFQREVKLLKFTNQQLVEENQQLSTNQALKHILLLAIKINALEHLMFIKYKTVPQRLHHQNFDYNIKQNLSKINKHKYTSNYCFFQFRQYIKYQSLIVIQIIKQLYCLPSENSIQQIYRMKNYTIAQLLEMDTQYQGNKSVFKSIKVDKNTDMILGQKKLDFISEQKYTNNSKKQVLHYKMQQNNIQIDIRHTNNQRQDTKMVKFEQNKLILVNNKVKSQLHKKLNILNHQENSILPVTNFKGIKQGQKTAHVGSNTMVYIDILPRFVKQDIQIQAKPECLDNKNIDVIIVQNQDYVVYIGQLNDKELYMPRRKIYLNSQITSLVYLPVKQTKAKISLNNNKQSTKYKRIPEDKLLIGCKNGNLYIINQFTQHIYQKNNIQLGYQCIIETKNKFQSTKKQQNIVSQQSITQILLNLQKSNTIYVVIDGKRIKRYDYGLFKLIIQSLFQQKQNQLQPKQLYTYIQYDPAIKILTNSPIISLQYIKINKNVNKTFLLIYMKNMHAPCILDQTQISLWFPDRLDKLVQVFNQFWQDQHDYDDILTFNSFLKPNKNKQPLQEFQTIQTILYSDEFEQLVIACDNDIVYFGKIIPSQQLKIQKYKVSNFKDQNTAKGFHNTRNKVTLFNQVIQRHFGFKQDSKLLSLAILKNQPYICISYQSKIIFYDMQSRKYFSKNLKQKDKNIINHVSWSSLQKPVFFSKNTSQGKCYIYSNQLPVRQKAINEDMKLQYQV